MQIISTLINLRMKRNDRLPGCIYVRWMKERRLQEKDGIYENNKKQEYI